MAAAILAAALAGRGTLSPAAPAAQSASKKAAPIEDYGGLPVGKGREVVFGLCQACHSLAIVKQQGLSRDSWDETLTWMVEEQEMPALDPATRNLVLDYLATHFGLGKSPARAFPGATGPGGAQRPTRRQH